MKNIKMMLIIAGFLLLPMFVPVIVQLLMEFLATTFSNQNYYSYGFLGQIFVYISGCISLGLLAYNEIHSK
ncbi:MAG: hypothetical protein RSE24_01885 [Oscillospiraceae bacterium]